MTRLYRRHAYGWIPQLPDARDFSCPRLNQAMPARVDLRPGCPPVYDQGALGSCTANAIAAAFEFDEIRQKLPGVMPSRLFIYYNERVMEGTITSDSGANIRDGIKSINKQGVCPESEWPYVISKFKTRPPARCFTDALKDRSASYNAIGQSSVLLRQALAAGLPIVFGISVYDGFESASVAKTGVVPMPAKGESLLGGHAILMVGYDDATKRFTFRNSWGPSWGDKGYGYLPYAYVCSSSLTSDFWQVQVVTEGKP